VLSDIFLPVYIILFDYTIYDNILLSDNKFAKFQIFYYVNDSLLEEKKIKIILFSEPFAGRGAPVAAAAQKLPSWPAAP
jgi:hypothetical protein